MAASVISRTPCRPRQRLVQRRVGCQAGVRAALAPADQSREAVADVVAVGQAASRARDIDLYTVDADEAAAAARSLAVPLARLAQLRQSLLLRR